jgi:hypothetical protein
VIFSVGTAAFTVIVVVADFVGSAIEVAVTVADPGEPAVKAAAVEVWPEREPPVWLHVTPLDELSFVTVAEN